MTKIDERVEELLAKHPNLTKPEAIKIVTEKNGRKREKREAKTNKINAEKLKYEAKLLKDR
jgi:hypothetical protein